MAGNVAGDVGSFSWFSRRRHRRLLGFRSEKRGGLGRGGRDEAFARNGASNGGRTAKFSPIDRPHYQHDALKERSLLKRAHKRGDPQVLSISIGRITQFYSTNGTLYSTTPKSNSDGKWPESASEVRGLTRNFTASIRRPPSPWSSRNPGNS
ncbi:hypothetical protein L3X38_035333 [Prunus dulcis]|uniref:Uncharacterized protein n=1 Tax=Prunus dulcis TaxID=3755 RepID=A0AAD4YYQ2_PRUDU|nr:hypothetical protein L3X38_035333 [Prunus dulcis]